MRQVQALEKISSNIVIYVFSDGPKDSDHDRNRVVEVRELLNHPLFEDAQLNLQTHNLGCGPGMMFGINWFFSQVDSGIILEDDCILHSSSPQFFQRYLDHYSNDPRVAIISGFNPIFCHYRDNFGLDKAFLSRVPITYGWATWAHKWFEHQSYHANHTGYRIADVCGFALGGHLVASYVFESYIMEGLSDASNIWDYQWYLTCFAKGWLTYFPSANYVINIGLGTEATHPSTDNFLESCSHMTKEDESGQADPIFPALQSERLILRYRYHATIHTSLRILARKNRYIRKLSDRWRILRKKLDSSSLQATSDRMLEKI